jgi:WD40 repeat protein
VSSAHDLASVWDVKFGPVCNLFVTSGGDKVANVWQCKEVGEGDPTEATLVTTLDGHHTEDVFATAYGSDGSIFTGGGDGTAARWIVGDEGKESGTGTSNKKISPITIYTGHTKHIRSLCVTDSVEWLVTGSVDCTSRQYNVDSGDCLRIFSHIAGIRGVACQGDLLVTAGMDGKSYFWLLSDDQIDEASTNVMITKDAGQLTNVSKFAAATSSSSNIPACRVCV